MSIKISTKVIGPRCRDNSFPRLMIDKDEMIVLFSNPMEGTVIYQGIEPYYIVGEVFEDWNIKNFTDYNEPITIQNEN